MDKICERVITTELSNYFEDVFTVYNTPFHIDENTYGDLEYRLYGNNKGSRFQVVMERKLEEEEKNISANNTNDYIRKEQLKEINAILSDESVDLLDSQIMRTLLNCIKVIDKHTVEFQFNCNLNIIEKL